MVKLKFLIISMCLALSSCYLLFDQAVLPIPEDISKKGLRLDGYYFTVDKFDDNPTMRMSNILIPFCIGVNYGVMGHCAGVITNNYNKLLMEADKDLRTEILSVYDNFHNDWGTIQISSDSIFLRKTGGRVGDCIHTYSGRILNDTTFTITYRSSTRCAGDSYEERQPDTLNLLFHFRKFSPKPDSSAYMQYLLELNRKEKLRAENRYKQW